MEDRDLLLSTLEALKRNSLGRKEHLLLKEDPTLLKKWFSPSRKTEEDLNRWEKEYSLIPFFSSWYPSSLKELPDFPLLLFAKGDISLLNKAPIVSIVGTRRPSIGGRILAFLLSSFLCRKGIVILSGVAQGIDEEAHRGALQGEGKTIGILPCGINRVSQKRKEISTLIEKKGLLLSEFLPDEHMRKYYPPLRNRLIARLSSFIILVDSPLKSGSLITAQYAIRYQVPVFAFSSSFLKQNQGALRLLEEKKAYDLSSFIKMQKDSLGSFSFLYQNSFFSLQIQEEIFSYPPIKDALKV